MTRRSSLARDIQPINITNVSNISPRAKDYRQIRINQISETTEGYLFSSITDEEVILRPQYENDQIDAFLADKAPLNHTHNGSDLLITTDDVNEGSHNLYFTDTRVSNSPDVVLNTQYRHLHSNIDVLNQLTQDDLDNIQAIPTTTDELTEGNHNLYYTETRVSNNADVSLNTQYRHTHTNKSILDSITDTGTGTKFLSDKGVYSFIDVNGIPNTTDDLPEGSSNLYYTDTRVSANSDVVLNTAYRHDHSNKTLLDSITDSGSGDKFLSDDGSYKFISLDMSDYMLKSVYDPNNVNGNAFDYNNLINKPDIPQTTDDLTEGSTNLYYTDTRVSNNNDVSLNTSSRHDHSNKTILDQISQDDLDNINNIPQTTDDLTEGSTNLYYTSARFDYNFQYKNIDDLKNVNITSPDAGNILSFDGTYWVDTKLNIPDGDMEKSVYDPTGVEADTFNYNNLYNKPDIPNNLGDLGDVDTSGAISDQVLQFDGTNWKPGNTSTGTGDMEKSVYDPNNKNADAFDYINFINTPTIPTNIEDLSNVEITSVSNDQFLQWNGTNWVNVTITPSGGDMQKVVYDPNNVEADSFDFNNFINVPNDITNLSTHSVTELTDISSAGSGYVITDVERTKLNGIEDGAEKNVNADWNATTGDAEILNKPSDITDLSTHSVTELNDVTSSGSGQIITDNERLILSKITDTGSGQIITDTERTKLNGIEDGAEVNVQSDWNETDSLNDAFILNKPSDITDLSTHSVTELNDVTSSGSGKIITDTERTKLSGIEENAQVNTVNSVFGRTGNIVATNGDYNATQISYTGTTSGLAASNVQSAIDEVQSNVLTKMHWYGKWINVTYPKNAVVVDDGWLMIANTETDDRAKPIEEGDPFYPYNGTNMIDVTHPNQVNYLTVGTRFTTASDGYVKGYRFYIHQTDGYRYRLVHIDRTDELNPQYNIGQIHTFETIGIKEISVDPVFVLSGVKHDFLLLIENHNTTPVDTTINYDYDTPRNTGTPSSGVIQHANSLLDHLKVHKTDNDGNDQSTYLATLVGGDKITIGDITYEIISASDQTDYVDFTVTPASQYGSDGVIGVIFSHHEPATIKYAREDNFWSTTSYNAKGVIQEDGIDNLVEDDNFYPIEPLIQRAIVSPYWDFMATTTTLGGGSGSVDTSDFMTQTVYDPNDIEGDVFDSSNTNFSSTGDLTSTKVSAALDELNDKKPDISTEDELSGRMKIAVVATLPTTQDPDTIYLVSDSATPNPTERIKDITSDYTITNNDDQKILECDGTLTITLPDGLDNGIEVAINNIGTGSVTINASTTLNGKGNKLTTQWASCMVYHKENNNWRIYGDIE